MLKIKPKSNIRNKNYKTKKNIMRGGAKQHFNGPGPKKIKPTQVMPPHLKSIEADFMYLYLVPLIIVYAMRQKKKTPKDAQPQAEEAKKEDAAPEEVITS